jgi:glucose/arabinose dehydrogenase
MKKHIYTVFILFLTVILAGCNDQPASKQEAQANGDADTVETNTAQAPVTLPPPFATESVKNFSKVTGWPQNQAPVAPEGFTVTKFAGNLDNPRWVYIAPNGDVLVSEANTKSKGLKKVKDAISGKSKSQGEGEGGNRVLLFRDANRDGRYEKKIPFLSGLNKPFGMLIIGNSFYVANTDGVWQYPYKEGDTIISSKGKLIKELPAGGYNNHWTRNIITNADRSKIYVSVGSGSNVGENGMENEVRRANILVMNPDGTNEQVYASGLRNPVGMDWAPGTPVLWTAVNERDGLGDELVPDYLTSVQQGGFYGWPYAYFGNNEDPRRKGENPGLVQKTLVPDVALGSHTASLGLAFYTKNAFPEKYRNGAFIGQHGSWNHSQLVGYKVVFVPFKNGKPSGAPEDFLTGFIADKDKKEVYGRPVGVGVLQDGSLLVTDDAGNSIWQVSARK